MAASAASVDGGGGGGDEDVEYEEWEKWVVGRCVELDEKERRWVQENDPAQILANVVGGDDDVVHDKRIVVLFDLNLAR